MKRPRHPGDRDVQNRGGLTVGVRYDAQRHQTVMTVRCNGKILEQVRMPGSVYEDEARIKRLVAQIRHAHRYDCPPT